MPTIIIVFIDNEVTTPYIFHVATIPTEKVSSIISNLPVILAYIIFHTNLCTFTVSTLLAPQPVWSVTTSWPGEPSAIAVSWEVRVLKDTAKLDWIATAKPS